MFIKEDKKLKIGQVITYPVQSYDIETAVQKVEELDLVVTEVYPHHVLCYCIKYPYKKISIMNVDLMQKGIYKKTDNVFYTDPENCLHGTVGGLKFFGKQT